MNDADMICQMSSTKAKPLPGEAVGWPDKGPKLEIDRWAHSLHVQCKPVIDCPFDVQYTFEIGQRRMLGCMNVGGVRWLHREPDKCEPGKSSTKYSRYTLWLALASLLISFCYRFLTEHTFSDLVEGTKYCVRATVESREAASSFPPPITEEDVTTLTYQAGVHKKYENDLDEKNSRINSLMSQLKSLKDGAIKETGCAPDESITDTLEAIRDIINRVNKDRNSARRTMGAEKAELEKERSSLQQKLAQKESETFEATQKIKSLEQSLEGTKQDVDKVSRDNANIEASKELYFEECEQLKTTLEGKDENIDRLKVTTDTQEQKIISMEQTLQERFNGLKDLENELQYLKAEKRELEKTSQQKLEQEINKKYEAIQRAKLLQQYLENLERTQQGPSDSLLSPSRDPIERAPARTPPGHSQASSPQGEQRFYKGGQFIPGGGRAPAGGIYMPTNSEGCSSGPSAAPYTPPSHCDGSREMKFFQGGQFVPGGGRAPKGGEYHPVPY